MNGGSTDIGRLIIVSNRLPYTLTRTPEGWSSAPSTGGLATAIEPQSMSRVGWDGVLVLSEFAGAATEMREAFLVNPYDEERTAETIVRARGGDEEQQHERMRRLYQRVTANNIFEWATRFLSEVRLASSNNDSQRLEEKTRPLSIVNEVSRAEFTV